MKTRDLIHKAWGNGYDNLAPIFGPFKGNEYEHAEAVIHELCHAVLLKCKFNYGKCHGLEHLIGAEFRAKSNLIGDLHEIRALAAEILVLKSFNIKQVNTSGIYFAGLKNVEFAINNNRLYHVTCAKEKHVDSKLIEKLINKSIKTKRVKNAAKAVYKFIKYGNN